MKNSECDVCSLLPIKQPLYETEYWVVSLSPDQGYLGRCHVSLKEHKAELSDLTNDEWLDYVAIVKKLEHALRLAFGAPVFNWASLMNNAFQKKPAYPHVHWHFRPRYESAITIDEIEFKDPLFGYHYDRGQSEIVPPETYQKIFNKIKEYLY